MTPTQEQIEEARKLVAEWNNNKGLACSHTKVPVDYLEKLLEATSLITASEQRERCVQIIKHSIEGYQNELGENDYVSLEELKEAQIDQILNQDSQQTISSNQK